MVNPKRSVGLNGGGSGRAARGGRGCLDLSFGAHYSRSFVPNGGRGKTPLCYQCDTKVDIPIGVDRLLTTACQSKYHGARSRED